MSPPPMRSRVLQSKPVLGFAFPWLRRVRLGLLVDLSSGRQRCLLYFCPVLSMAFPGAVLRNVRSKCRGVIFFIQEWKVNGREKKKKKNWKGKWEILPFPRLCKAVIISLGRERVERFATCLFFHTHFPEKMQLLNQLFM